MLYAENKYYMNSKKMNSMLHSNDAKSIDRHMMKGIGGACVSCSMLRDDEWYVTISCGAWLIGERNFKCLVELECVSFSGSCKVYIDIRGECSVKFDKRH